MSRARVRNGAEQGAEFHRRLFLFEQVRCHTSSDRYTCAPRSTSKRTVYEFLRRLMFLLPPETSHEVALTALRIAERSRLSQRYIHGIYQPTTVMGLKFRNRVGLAAGLDKDARCIEGLLAMGFGFIEVGTVTPRPQPGNPRPRLFRLPSEARADQSHGVQQRRCGGRSRTRAFGARRGSALRRDSSA